MNQIVRWTMTLCLSLLCGTAALAKDPPKPVRRAPLTITQAADAVVAAIESGDEETIRKRAVSTAPDVWLVADELCARGAFDAALTLAKAAPPASVRKLPAYVERARTREDDKEARALRARLQVMWSKDQAKEVLAETKGVNLEPDTVVGVYTLRIREWACWRTRQHLEQETLARLAGKAARELGWLRLSVDLWFNVGVSAYAQGAWDRAFAGWTTCLEVAREQENRRMEASAVRGLGIVCNRTNRLPEALRYYEKAAELFEAIGRRGDQARTLVNAGNVLRRQEDLDGAIATLQAALVVLVELKDGAGQASAHTGMGNIHLVRSDFPAAVASYRAALDALEGLGEDRRRANALVNLATAQRNVGDLRSSLRTYESALKIYKRLKRKPAEAETRRSMGVVYKLRGRFAKALTQYKQALAIQVATKNHRQQALTLGDMGNAYRALGDYANALDFLERSLALHKSLKNAGGVATTLNNIANVHSALGDYKRALTLYEQVLAEHEAREDKRSIALTVGNIGGTLLSMGEHEEALPLLKRAVAENDAIGSRLNAAASVVQLGYAYGSLEQVDKALETFEDARKRYTALGAKLGIAQAHIAIGRAYSSAKRYTEARASLATGIRMARALRATPTLITALESLAVIEYRDGAPAQALATARQALTELERVLGGLGQEQGATARSIHARLFAVGTVAALADDDLAAALTFMESGRAGALLEVVDNKELLRWKRSSLPEELQVADNEALAAQREARAAYDEAVQTGKRTAIRAASKALDEATDAVRAVADRIQRTLKQQAGLFYPRAESIESVQESLEEGQALVLYGMCIDEAVALVLQPDSARAVQLGSVETLAEACEALDPTNANRDAAPALATLRELLVDPLELGADVTHVLISPEGPLCYVPFSALLDRSISITPSGTTHVLLREEERESGSGVLALGAPDYAGASESARAIYHRGRQLTVLEGSRKEVEAVGTQVLLGPQASEPELRKALAAAGDHPLRAIHFACHGLVDIKRPMLSSLALSRGAEDEDDGFLTALEILRMEIPADLAVLSACDTGRGRIVRGEGIVGLTRAFMFAGTPRVICSLWQVDDAATQALMVKFYELWNPKSGEGLSASAALRKAQEHIRAQEKWKHPYFWAAWVLWGLPE